MKKGNDNSIQLLWTGGWDSTFRLLEIIFEEEKPVQPIYIIDPNRKSTLMELLTQEKIKKIIQDTYFKRSTLIKNTQIEYLPNIPMNEEITSSWKQLYNEYSLGTQYEWLARFAKDKLIQNLEMSIEYSDRKFTQALLQRVEKQGNECRLTDNIEEVWNILAPFSFPILHIEKLDMQEKAKNMGVLDILNETWYCHHPKKGEPCRKCKPCKIAEENFPNKKKTFATLFS